MTVAQDASAAMSPSKESPLALADAAAGSGADTSASSLPWLDFAHTGPATLAGRFMRSFWHPVCRIQDLQPGRTIPIRIMSEDFTLYRGEGRTFPLPLGEGGGEGRPPAAVSPNMESITTGVPSHYPLPEGEGTRTAPAPHLLALRCAHRGTQLSTGWVEGEDLRCFYHGWKYDATGRCIEQPAEPEPFCSRIKIKSYPVQEYLGLIFAYLGDGEPPDLPRYEEFEEEGILENGGTTVWAVNFFNRLENSPDPVHLAFVHRSSPFSESGLVDVPAVSGAETDYGIEVQATRPGDKTRITHFHIPNINLIANSETSEEMLGSSINLSWRVPIDDEHCMSFNATHVALKGAAADEYRARRSGDRHGGTPAPDIAVRVLRGDLRIADITERTNIVNVQDYVAQAGQGAIAPREHDHLGRSDVLVVLLRKIWERELRALAEGRPLKQWRRTARVATAYGV
jgi:5,5'-dehydrodivanillate O-demethylase oxygenase subunit